MQSNTRAQSETVGVILLTGVVLLVTVSAGAIIISNVASQGDDVPSVNIEGQATTQYVTIDHTGGNRLATSDVAVILDGAQRERYSLADFTQRVGDDDTRFEPGDTWRHTNEVGDDNIRILVVHEPSNTILDEVTVAVEVTIVARFSHSPANPTPVDTVTFDASDSEIDEEGELDGYEWDFNGDGTTDQTGETVDYSFSDDGKYPVTLTVTADDGRTASRTKTVRVYNVFPDAEFTYPPSNPDPGDQITFDASASNDPDGSIESYEWDFDDDGTVDATGETTTNSYGSEGNYTVRLNVTDDDGASRRIAKTVGVGTSAGAPSGEVDVQDEINKNDQSFDVTTSNFTNLNSSTGGYLVVSNGNENETFENVGETTETINNSDLNFKSDGIIITATLYETSNASGGEVNQLDSDSTTVTTPGEGGDGGGGNGDDCPGNSCNAPGKQ